MYNKISTIDITYKTVYSDQTPSSYFTRALIARAITVRNSSFGKVMLSQACVKNSVHRGEVYTPPGHIPPGHPQADTPAGQTPPGHTTSQHPPRRRRSGRYASYWNTFLLSIDFQIFV